ncbi:Arm DNA-binding domain-containing protein [Myroides odoratus]|uniref:Arm DNA-binding domain-containing protein n=1 Tax=Myroides odoratus TaxID=256 RepID=UPI003340485F
MEIHQLNLLFIISRSRTTKQGLAPINCRLTYKEQRKQFVTGLFIKPIHWQNSKQSAHPSTEENNFINSVVLLKKRSRKNRNAAEVIMIYHNRFCFFKSCYYLRISCKFVPILQNTIKVNLTVMNRILLFFYFLFYSHLVLPQPLQKFHNISKAQPKGC